MRGVYLAIGDLYNGTAFVLLLVWQSVIDFFSAEFLLDVRANGGAVIILRAVWSAWWLWQLAVVLKLWIDPTISVWDTAAYRRTLAETVPWFGTIVGGAYAALYARFASQWTYVANIYNQIKAAEAREDKNLDVIAEWKAGYIEDACDLHLIGKPSIANTATHWLQDERVRDALEKFGRAGQPTFRRYCPALR